MHLKFIFIGILTMLHLFICNGRESFSGGQSFLAAPFSAIASNRYFVENAGQIRDQYGNPRSDIDFQFRDKGTTLYIGSGKIHYQMERPLQAIAGLMGESAKSTYTLETYRVELTLIGANENAITEKQQRLPLINRYYGTGMPQQGYAAGAYQKICYKNIYPNIDWVIYLTKEGIEYDFVVHPGGKVADIQMEYRGADKVNLDRLGGLEVASPFGTIQESSPFTYREDGTVIPSEFVVDNNRIFFKVASHNGKITIDPKVKWGTYLGGTLMFDGVAYIESDSRGNVYCSGETTSSNIATSGSFKNTISGLIDVFLCKFDAGGKQIWGTYFGGLAIDRAGCLSIDGTGNAYLMAGSDASGLATTGAHQTVAGGLFDFVLSKFDPDGQRIWTTYLGGSGNEGAATANILVKGNDLYVTGVTESANNIASPGAERTMINGAENLFLAKFNLAGQRVWSTYVQNSDTTGNGTAAIASGRLSIDSKGNIYLPGHASGKGWSTPGSHQPTRASASPGDFDAILLKYDSSGKKLWGTYYGGLQQDFASSTICDKEDNVYLAGFTQSTTGIGTPGSLQPDFSARDTAYFDLYIAKFDESGKRLWGTYLGGMGHEWNPDLNIFNGQYLLLSSTSNSPDIPTTGNAIQKTYAGSRSGFNYGDWYLAKLSFSGEMLWGSFYGGAGDEAAFSSCISGSDVYVCGVSNSDSGVATPGSHMDTYTNPLLFAGLIAKFCFSEVPEAGFISGPDSICAHQVHTYRVADIGDIESCIWTLPDGWTGSSTGTSIEVTNSLQGGNIAVQIIRCGDTSATTYLPVYVFPAIEAVITVDERTLSTLNVHDLYQWMLNDEIIDGATERMLTVNQNGGYRVVVTDVNGCVDTSDVYIVNNVSIGDNYPVQNRVRVFPNPATTQLHIQAAIPVVTTLFSIDGKILISKSKAPIIDLHDYSTGIYLIQVQDGDGNTLYKDKLIKM